MSAQLAFAFEHRPAMGREDLLVTPANAEAVAWVDRWPEWPGPALVLTGPAGCGKSHLAAVWRARAGARALAASALDTLPAGATEAPAAAVLVEDLEGAGAGLFHLHRSLAEAGGWLLLTARRPPVEWQITLPDLRSRLLAAPVVAIRAPDDQLLVALLAKLFHDRQVIVGDAVLSFLATRIERSFAAAAEVVARLDAAALDAGQAVSIALARRMLETMER